MRQGKIINMENPEEIFKQMIKKGGILMSYQIGDLKLELTEGDIAAQADIEAVVNAANAELRIGGGVAGAIHRGAGPELEKECRAHAPIKVGEAVITGAYNLPNKFVIHTLGPVYGRDKPEADFLADCYYNSLMLAERNKISSIAFPAISTGAFGYPIQDAAEVALKKIKEMAQKLKEVKKLRFVLYNKSDLEVFIKKAEEIFS